ncbi:uncharacterized protein LOC132282087 [Cornus florida]|uniref:uncharacterized protein LOC132282087 n=1 Tax=Cornus florida TaxID=4283 RepID=UPI0028A10712|nr:uncharacterized protein LOC132282087 [Cornus florida]
MLNAFKSVRSQKLPTLISSPPFPSQIGRRISGTVSFRQAAANQPENLDNMAAEQTKINPNSKTGDMMSDSFGEGYSTRSDEEGFGGIYGSRNQSLTEEDKNTIQQNQPAYDKSQGSHVQEKEKARHQQSADS